ncbi:DUF1648 domain-containing protein [Propionispora hippei]|uniref:DUF1648 domain-containing protein n=1 Tax=Propionispora hippei DSM 15287 TaxID=1123003 RepID=A0A1M6KFG1_9FIRM|nr:DUF1648 domain-containing protein [Propionispora hippei]SHJ57648.1 Protein of unknown function [Propionispora hippei DSM 15287]
MAMQEVKEMLRKILTLELAALVLVIISFDLAMFAYPSLPNVFPIHFDFSGTPNGWSRKSWFAVLALPLTQLGLFIFVTILTWWCVNSKRALAYLNLPKVDRNRVLQLPDEKQEKIRLLSTISINVINFFTLLFSTIINYQILQAGIAGRSPSMFWTFMAVIFCFVGGFIFVRKIVSAVEDIVNL